MKINTLQFQNKKSHCKFCFIQEEREEFEDYTLQDEMGEEETGAHFGSVEM